MGGQKYGVAWSDDLKLGNARVDEQHRRLFELLSELVASCMDGTDTEMLRDTLNFLVEYTLRHFEDEESLQIEYSYPDYFRHKQLHEIFKCAVSGLVERFVKNGSSAELSRDVNKIVIRWLLGHIRKEDMRIGEHIRNMTGRG